MFDSSGIHTGISSWLPSIYPVWQVLRCWLMMTLLRGLSRWQSTAANLSLIYTPHVHTNACTHSLYLHHLQYTTFSLFFFFPLKCCLLLLPLLQLFLLFILSQPTGLPGGCWVRLMMLLYGTCITPNVAMKSVYSCNFTSEWFITPGAVDWDGYTQFCCRGCPGVLYMYMNIEWRRRKKRRSQKYFFLTVN